MKRRCLIFDPFAGISGDMVLGALLDVGLPDDWLLDLVERLPVKASVQLSRVSRGPLSARRVEVTAGSPSAARNLADVLDVVRATALPAKAREIATAVFRRLAEVEAAIHATPVDQIHFHEVGATDALVDIIGAADGIARLEVDQCLTRPVAMGRGWVEAEHGRLPVPAPATLRLLERIPVTDSGLDGELTTPTGAALLAVLTEGQPPAASFVPLRSGLGAGDRNPSTHPNCLRVILADLGNGHEMILLQADIDDMTPEYLAPLADQLREAGAVEVWTYNVQMKKGRFGLRIEALLPQDCRPSVSRALFENSTTLGLRFWPVDREVLPRGSKRIEWRGFPIRIKTRTTPGGHVTSKPEYDDIVEAARALGLAPERARREVEVLLRQGDEY